MVRVDRDNRENGWAVKEWSQALSESLTKRESHDEPSLNDDQVVTYIVAEVLLGFFMLS